MNKINTPITIAKHTIKNRICMPPLVCFGFGNDETGHVVQKNVEHYELRAKAGTGLIVVEATCVSENGKLNPNQLGIWSDKHIQGLAKIADVCHKYDATVIIQIHHGGFSTHPNGGEMVSPSPWETKRGIARELARDEIVKIQNDFVAAAIRAKRAGYDGIQLHGCHSYLLNAFSSKLVNKRIDKYGGNAKCRTRLACDIIKEIRKKCGKDFIIDIRMAGNDPTPEVGVENAKYYIDAGVDMLSVSAGIGDFDKTIVPSDFPLSAIAWLGVNIKNHNPNIPVAAVFGITTAKEAHELAEYVDFASAGKAMLADDNWSRSVLNDLPIKHPCVKCKRCFWFDSPEKCPAQNSKK